MSLNPELIQQVLIWALPVLIAITLHEAAHGIVAKWRGDRTAYALGRVSLNPIRHIDPIGTIALPLALVVMGTGFLFGYAKPVPVNFMNLKNLRQDTILVALAGPGANLVLAIVSILVLNVALAFPPNIMEPLVLMAWASVQINVMLMLFNLLPILPLDGGRVLHALLPPHLAMSFGQTERYGFIIVLLLAFTGILFTILSPLYFTVMSGFALMVPQG